MLISNKTLATQFPLAQIVCRYQGSANNNKLSIIEKSKKMLAS